MTLPIDRNADMPATLLQFLGSFSHLQDWMDAVIQTFLAKRMGRAGDAFTHRVVPRIKDEERLALIKAIAVEVDSAAEMSEFGAVFKRVKKLRDNVAHSATHRVEGDRLMVTKTVIDSGSGRQVIEFDRDHILEAVHECRWLEAQVMYVSRTKDIFQKVYLGTVPMETLKPTRLPKDWDGEVFRAGPSAE